MDQNASAALIASIVAVVLGALGLVGGVIGYVQGTAALRRATIIRQRATAAEDAALQARMQAEQSARTAQSVLDRLEGLQLRSLGDVANLPTGPLVLPPRLVPSLPPPTGEIAAMPFGTLPAAAPEAPSRAPQTAATVFDPTPARPVTEDPARGADTTEAEDVAAEPQPEPEHEPEPEDDPEPEPAGDTGAGEPEPETEAEPIPAPATESDPGPDADPAPDADPEADATSGPEPAAAVRSATGQVTAGAQEAPPMDWAEALRTGSIPLPARSRGTYAAPSKRGKRDSSGPARFEIRAVGRQSYEAVNVGGASAEQAVVEGAGEDRHLVRPMESRPMAVPPGGTLAFSVLRVEGREVTMRITWMHAGRDEAVELPLP